MLIHHQDPLTVPLRSAQTQRHTLARTESSFKLPVDVARGMQPSYHKNAARTCLTLRLRLSEAFRTKGDFRDNVELSLSLRLSCQGRRERDV